jgi:hypothetical protein
MTDYQRGGGASLAAQTPPLAGKLAIITVHGTNDDAPADEGGRWWQTGSDFTTALCSRLAQHGITDTEIIPHHWSGANSDYNRLKGSAALAAKVRALEKSGQAHAIIAHSHGGNVVMEGLAAARSVKNLASVVTFGTPFFLRHLKTVPFLIALFQLILGVVVAPIMIWYLAAILPSDSNKKIESLILFGGLFIFALWSLRTGYRALTRRWGARRCIARAIDPAHWLVIHSPRDEAMRLLETAAAIAPKYVTVESAVRSITNLGTVAGVVGTMAAFGFTWRYFLDPIITKVNARQFDLGTAADFTFLLLVPLVYGAIFAVVWAFARLGGGWLYAKILSLLIHGGVIGAAYGGDGRFKLTGVTRTPAYLPNVVESRIDALNLGGIDEKAVFLSAQKLYDDIVADDGPNTTVGDPDKLWKRLSDALYHNAYMRDAGVISHVADHIVANLRSRAQR